MKSFPRFFSHIKKRPRVSTRKNRTHWHKEKIREKKSRMFHLDRDYPIKTWNPVIGCKYYCYKGRCWAARMARRLKNNERYREGFDHPKLVAVELKKRFSNIVVFVSSMGDLFGRWVPEEWILKVLNSMKQSHDAVFLLETKNPARFLDFISEIPSNTILSTTIETNRTNNAYRVSAAPSVVERYKAIRSIEWPHKHVSIEPIIDFDLDVLVRWMRDINPELISVGYDNYHNHLPEPSLDKTMRLIEQLEKFSKVERKTLREACDRKDPPMGV